MMYFEDSEELMDNFSLDLSANEQRKLRQHLSRKSSLKVDVHAGRSLTKPNVLPTDVVLKIFLFWDMRHTFVL